jgi:phosphopantothenoylcysteine synthetase/decarboxylase
MNILVTAGNTLALIDQVRCITNIFTGRTGASIALCAHGRGHRVMLLTSHPEAVGESSEDGAPADERWSLRRYRTFEDLQARLAELIGGGGLDAVVHCAAVSDYLSAGVYAAAEGTSFDEASGQWHRRAGSVSDRSGPALVDRRAGKVKSDEPELWIRLKRAPKLVDLIRSVWGFRGVLVKFKLEVGLSDEDLLKVAEASRVHSDADVMVANTLEGAPFWAFIGRAAGQYERIGRRDLAGRLLEVMEQLHTTRS